MSEPVASLEPPPPLSLARQIEFRPLVLPACAFIAGILLREWFPGLTTPAVVAAIALVALVPLVFFLIRRTFALHALVMLRAAGSKARFWGCIADAAADRVLALGMIEPAMKPLDPDAIVEILGRYAARGTRVVTAGADVDGLMSLRQALAPQSQQIAARLEGLLDPDQAVRAKACRGGTAPEAALASLEAVLKRVRSFPAC